MSTMRPDDFQHLYISWDDGTGAALIRGQVRVPGLRLVWRDKGTYVLYRPPHSYASLTGASRAPASFEVYADAYGSSLEDDEERRADGAACRAYVRHVISFPTTVHHKPRL